MLPLALGGQRFEPLTGVDTLGLVLCLGCKLTHVWHGLNV
jgi:hypothetical protein